MSEMNNTKLLITKEGKQKLVDELKQLIEKERPKIIEELNHARMQGDLSENADFDAAKQKQAEIEERIRVLAKQISDTEITEENIKSIGIGSLIKFEYLDTKVKDEVKIVGAFESNPFDKIKKISYESPFAKAILKNKNKIKTGIIIEIPMENSPYKIKILSIT